MVKKLIAYGDSFVMGGGILPNNTTYPDSWPQLLGKKLGIEAINRGVGGGSNKRSINNLLEDIEIIKQENVLVIFSWTSPQRTVFFDEKYQSWQNYLVGHEHPDYYIQKKYKFYFELLYSDTDAILTLYNQQLFLSSFLDSIKVPHFFINSFNELQHNNKLFLNFVKNYRLKWPHIFDMIDKNKYMLGYDDSIHNSICKNLGKTCSDHFHLSEEGHEILASMMVDYINKNNFI
jgi:lysophospholipase L1-like esterase